MPRKAILLFIFFLFLIQITAFADVPSPEQFLGFKPGTDRKLADMRQIVAYFKILGENSGRVAVEEVGKTTLGNPFIVAVITAEKNQSHLSDFQNYQQLLADPRKISPQQAEEIIRDKGKTVVMINCSIHASEIGASQMAMQLAYDLATSQNRTFQEILDKVILLLVPMHNPDGVQMVVDWYRQYLGTPYEGGRMPWLYNKYVGHDNNRDWYMFTQVESRLTLKVHNAWHPQIIVDMHQMGSRGARLFVPPYVDPFEPNVDPILQQEVGMMGTFIATELTSQGKAGVIHSSRYDAWTPARAYHHYHGGIRILTECASVRVATPIKIEPFELAADVRKPSVRMPLPWQGGDWTLEDIVDYDYAAAVAALTNAARLRENWLRNFYRIHWKAVNRTAPPFAFVVPAAQGDYSTTLKLLEVLKLGAVEIHQAQEDFAADGKTFSAASFIIYMAQPYGSFAKTLLEPQVYPEIRAYPGGPLKPPYDVVAHTLPLLMGVKVIQISKPFSASAELLRSLPAPQSQIDATTAEFYGYFWDSGTNDAIVAAERLLEKGFGVSRAAEDFHQTGSTFKAGSFFVKKKKGLSAAVKNIADDLNVHFQLLKENPDVRVLKLKKPKLGLYHSWSASMDEGWTRWVLEQFEIPYTRVENKMVKNGNLNKKFDVLILPDIHERMIVKGISEKSIPPEYAGGIEDVGVKNVIQFVENGGALITLNRAASFAIKYFQINVVDSSRKWTRKDFYCPGSILRAKVDNRHPVAYGYGSSSAIFFRGSPVFSVNEGTSVVTYPDKNLLLSGWINGGAHLAGKSAIVEVKRGKGKIILIGFPTLYRGQAHATFRFLFNSIFYGSAKEGKF
ncbi:MAG: hypothetical protein GXO74_10845 [Calditrichaeota bacterium]|nr:hypothetical protein [Calditrichota bacterium]